MLSQRGLLTLIHTQHQMESAQHKANWLVCNGVDGGIIDKDQVREMFPHLNMDERARFPVLGAGVDIIQSCEVTGFEKSNSRIDCGENHSRPHRV